MAKYIDAAAFVGERLTSIEQQLRFREMTGTEAYNDFLRLVNEMPTADVAPVRHGRWSGNYCTVCGLSWDANMCLNADDDGYFDPMPNYCPNCGARCDSEE